MQWLQDPSQINVDNLNNIRRNVSTHFTNKKKEYLKAKIEEPETNSTIKNIRDLYRGINGLKKGYQPRTDIVKDEKGDLVADSHSILASCRNHFSQLLNTHGVNDARQTEIHTTEPILPEPNAFELEMAIEELKRRISPGSDQIKAELIKAGVEYFALGSKNVLILFGKKRNYLSGRSRSPYLFIRRVLKQIVVITEAYTFFSIFYKIIPN